MVLELRSISEPDAVGEPAALRDWVEEGAHPGFLLLVEQPQPDKQIYNREGELLEGQPLPEEPHLFQQALAAELRKREGAEGKDGGDRVPVNKQFRPQLIIFNFISAPFPL